MKQDEGRYAFLKFFDPSNTVNIAWLWRLDDTHNSWICVERNSKINVAPSTRMTREKGFFFIRWKHQWSR